jgi:demethylmenaquinone methyltransferase/2-methoxy-6-polyprenyl-1,4-benzoquinol methylase
MGRTSITLASLVDAELTRQAALADSQANESTSVAAPAIQRPAQIGLPQLSSQGDSSEVSVDLRGPMAHRVQTEERGTRSTTFRQVARSYDTATGMFNAFRAKAVDLLGLTPGQIVLDVGCGTGLCFSYVQQRIGPTGRIIGIDRSVEMLAQADIRCTRHGWWNVTLIESDVESADIRSSADAALFCAAHDILQSPAAIRNVLNHVRRGGRCAAVGAKWAPPWLAGFNVLTALAHGPYVRSFVGFDKPWTVLMQHVPQLQVTEIAFGTGYAAVGQIR